jgi:hypothetical protein
MGFQPFGGFDPMTRHRIFSTALTGIVLVVGASFLASQVWAEFVAPAGGTGQVRLVEGPPPVSYSNSALLSFADLGSTEALNFECNLDGSGWQDCNSSHSPGSLRYWGEFIMPDLNPGSHTVQIRTNGSESGSYSWQQAEPTPAMVCSRWRDWYATQSYLIDNPDVSICPEFVQTEPAYKKNFPENGYPETPRCRPTVCN